MTDELVPVEATESRTIRVGSTADACGRWIEKHPVGGAMLAGGTVLVGLLAIVGIASMVAAMARRPTTAPAGTVGSLRVSPPWMVPTQPCRGCSRT